MDGKEIRRLFGSNVKRLRSRYGLSQLGLAIEIGMTHNFINDIENGKKWVSSQTIAKLAQKLHAKPVDFFISDTTLEQQEADFITTYIDDLSQSVLKAVTETKSRYMRDTVNRTTDVATAIETAKADVAKLVADINTLIPVVQTELAKAEKAGTKVKIDVKPIKDGLVSGAQVFADAQRSTNYADAKAKLQALKDSLTQAQQGLEAAGFKK